MGDVSGGFNHAVLWSIAVPPNSIVYPCRLVLVSDNFLHGVGIISFSIDASCTGFVSVVFLHESDMNSIFELYLLATIASRLIDTVFWIPFGLIIAYLAPILMNQQGPVRQDRSLE